MNRYAIVSRDWQRFVYRYVVIDTQRPSDWCRAVLQTNDFALAIQVRDQKNAEATAS